MGWPPVPIVLVLLLVPLLLAEPVGPLVADLLPLPARACSCVCSSATGRALLLLWPFPRLVWRLLLGLTIRIRRRGRNQCRLTTTHPMLPLSRIPSSRSPPYCSVTTKCFWSSCGCMVGLSYIYCDANACAYVPFPSSHTPAGSRILYMKYILK